jgi:hypothetical protein
MKYNFKAFDDFSVFGVYSAKYMQACYLAVVKDACLQVLSY